MTTAIDNPRLLEIAYDWAADDYLRSLPLEHFLESTDQSTQREITLESLALVRSLRPDFQVFSELLIQYPKTGQEPRPGRKRRTPQRVVPDNMVVIWPEPLTKLKAFHTPLQPVLPTIVMEYVSTGNKRKDYYDNFRRYRDDLRIPYYLLFEPDDQSLKVFHLEEGKYIPIEPNDEGRLAIPDMELEVGLVDGWVRYWHRGVQLALPGELMNQLRAKDDQLGAARERIREKDSEIARLREELAKLKQQQ